MAAFTVKLLFFIFGVNFIDSMPTNTILVDETDNEVINLARFGDAIFGEPDESVGRMVSDWTPDNDQNPEELGTYLEGDILITPNEARNGLVRESSRWKGGIIPYVFDYTVSAEDRAVIMRAIDVYHKQTCLKFVPRNNERDYISFESTRTGCWSSVGRIGGKQSLNLQSGGCTSKIGTPLHEICHAIGFFHEQNRDDRDGHVRILTQNIKPGIN